MGYGDESAKSEPDLAHWRSTNSKTFAQLQDFGVDSQSWFGAKKDRGYMRVRRLRRMLVRVKVGKGWRPMRKMD